MKRRANVNDGNNEIKWLDAILRAITKRRKNESTRGKDIQKRQTERYNDWERREGRK